MSPKVRRSASQIKTDIKVRVVPRSSRNQIIGVDDGIFKIKLTAPPVDGKANNALREFLAKRLGLAKGSVEIISGERSRQKSVRIYGLTLEDVNALLGD
ncbi:MAG: YggU family protein [Deltaproteobacteria bacterium]|nr:YggU family protein [Deltaproteobacteria bacterium]MBW2345451.1 YggU family protein [Deltaproteobacteria bacterium]